MKIHRTLICMYFELNVLQTDIDIVVVSQELLKCISSSWVSLCLVLLQVPNILGWSIFLFLTKNWFTYCSMDSRNTKRLICSVFISYKHVLVKFFPKNPQRPAQQIPAVPWPTSKEKKTQICHQFVQTTGLLIWLSFCVLTIWYFRPFSNTGLQSPRDLPSP